MASLQDFNEDIPLFVEAGLIAVKQGDEESAKKLFNAVGVLDPENTNRTIGYGLIALHKMDTKNAQKYFDEVLRKEPNNYRAQAFLAFSYVASVLKEDISADEKADCLRKGAELADHVVKNCDTPSTKALAESLLDWEDEMQKKAEVRGPAG